jgi:peptidoglycan/LPS O-acetylase OafA/YrhL
MGTAPRDSGHIRALDGIRGFAVVLVFSYHSLSNTLVPASWMTSFLRNVTLEGWAGVDLFFVLSGFLITTILLDARTTENYFKVFYVRRALRIFPLYYLVFLVALLLESKHVPFRIDIWYLLNLSNLPTAFQVVLLGTLMHFWSLAIEEQFYLVWPSIIRWCSFRTIVYLCIAAIIGLFFVRNLPIVLRANRHWPELVYRFTLFRVDTLCGGALLAFIVKFRPRLMENRWILRTLFIVSLGVIVACGRSYTNPLLIRFGYTALVLCCTSLIALALFPEGWRSRLFGNRALRLMGRYSYSFYLLHPFVVNYVFLHSRRLRTILIGLHLLPSGVAINTTVLLFSGLEFFLVLSMSALLWAYFEGPILKFKKHFRYSPRPEHYLA